MTNTERELGITVTTLSDQGLFNVIANFTNEIAEMTKSRKIILKSIGILLCLSEFERRVKEDGVILDVE